MQTWTIRRERPLTTPVPRSWLSVRSVAIAAMVVVGLALTTTHSPPTSMLLGA